MTEVKRRLGDTMARNLAAQDQLGTAVTQNSQQQEALKLQIQEARAQSEQLQANIGAADAEIKATQKRVDEERAAIGELARAEYVQPDSTLLRLLRSSSMKDWLVGVADIAAAGGRGEQLKAALEQDVARLNQEQATRQSSLESLSGLQARQAADLQQVMTLGQKQVEASRLLTAQIGATRAELKKVDHQDPALADRISQALDDETSRIIGLANLQTWVQVDLAVAPNAVVQTSQSVGHSARSQFIWPMPKGPITQVFGPSQLGLEPPFNGFPHFHTGVDIAGPENEPVLAADDGQVVLAATGASGYGNYVVLSHGQGLTTLYGHLNQILVRQGDHVSQGSPIGLEGSTGNSTGPHVHFEVRVNGVPVNPATYLPSGSPSPTRA
ncbi:MAG: peptidoglycan DD-metalloendopeptidase family protein [Candidatus Dormibacteraeota bacterium]|nr:peptidoglycan DD-metalloendopeptidase family protein [Candidatus Dormibacteraeota bacterium]